MASPRGDPSASTPICRCRVLYLGSAVPHVTKDGLQGIQEPLRELYPEQGALGARGIDSWLSVWSNGLLLENVDENHKKVTRFFPIDTLHYCAAVRYVLVPEKATAGGGGGGGGPATPRFLPLDSPFARSPNPSHPPLFAAILRRTTGIKVLECHAFICKREMAANALVRCCFHAYADSSYARHIDGGGGGGNASIYGTLRSQANGGGGGGAVLLTNPIAKVEGWRRMAGGAGERGSTLTLNSQHHAAANNNGTLKSNATNLSAGDDVSIYNGDENHKVWAGTGTIERGASLGDEIYGGASTLKSTRSARPRQVVAPVGAPPPPPPAKDGDAKAAKKASKDKARRKKMMGGSREELYPLMNGSLMRGATLYAQAPGRSASSMSGTLLRGQQQHHYANGGGGTLMRPASAHQMNGYHHPHQAPPPHAHHPHHPHAHPHAHHPHAHAPPPVLLVPHPAATLPSNRAHKKMGTFSRPGSAKGGAVLLPPPPAPFVPMLPGPPPPAGPIMVPVPVVPTGTGKKSKHHAVVGPVPPPAAAAAAAMVHPVAIEEPIYMPSARPMSPVASFQPGHFPHEAYLLQQYATMDSKHRKKLTKHDRKAASTMVLNGVGHGEDEEEEGGPHARGDVEESPFNTGIYRKKGHLNERAFSYSIRQEHRSRSYGSLASLKFSTPIPNGGGPGPGPSGDASKEDIKKEREIMQMMHDLELSGDELERSEVPAAVFESRRAAAAAAAAAVAGGPRR